MFIAMNRFKVNPGSESEFERIWRERDTHLATVPGFVEFHLLKGPKRDDHTLYSSHTLWRSKVDFEAWTRSQVFLAAHSTAGNNSSLYSGHPEMEGFESVLELLPKGRAA
jgi:heme-degrading monooxygenase HmoA